MQGEGSVSVSVVNGYLCYSSCDEATARAGKDPHPKQNGGVESGNASGAIDPPAVTFGGALAGLNAIKPAEAGAAAEGVNLAPQRTSIDILA
jgi:hypothetical protein